jgi:hypothetical protein
MHTVVSFTAQGCKICNCVAVRNTCIRLTAGDMTDVPSPDCASVGGFVTHGGGSAPLVAVWMCVDVNCKRLCCGLLFKATHGNHDDPDQSCPWLKLFEQLWSGTSTCLQHPAYDMLTNAQARSRAKVPSTPDWPCAAQPGYQHPFLLHPFLLQQASVET